MAGTEISLSVIIPTYNRAQMVGRAIRSVLDQTYQDFEIVVVDDGSKDNTEEVVRSFNDKRVRYIKHERNEGVAAARNTGIKATRSKYIAFQDSDDEWLPEKLEKQMAGFRTASSNIGVVYTAFLKIEGDKKTYIPSPELTQKEGDIYNSLVRGNFVAPPAAVVKRECFAKAGMFDEGIPCFEDWELWLRISKYYHFKYIDEPLIIAYSGTPGSILADQGALARGYELILKKHCGDIKEKGRKLLAIYYIAAGNKLCLSGEFKRGRNYLIKAALAYPLNIAYLGAVLASLLGQRGYNKAAVMYQTIRGRFPKT
jgi:glycosyltransferase involved in cell wall biosynthesis